MSNYTNTPSYLSSRIKMTVLGARSNMRRSGTFFGTANLIIYFEATDESFFRYFCFHSHPHIDVHVNIFLFDQTNHTRSFHHRRPFLLELR